MKYILLIVLLVAILINAGCISENKSAVVTPSPENAETIIPVSPTSFVNQNAVVKNNGIIIFRNPEKIIRPEDLQIGDLIQMSHDDPRWDKDHGFIVENISPQNNQYLIKQIVNFKSENKWFGINTTNSVLITSGALMRDYPYKIGHVLEPLPQKCLMCGYPSGGDVNLCSSDALMFLDCNDPRIMYNRSSAIIYPP
jgi:hypothetical protein